MNRVFLDQSLRSRLNNLESSLELCDESGAVVAIVIPAEEVHESLYAWARREFTDEEIELARQEPGGFSTEEILAELK